MPLWEMFGGDDLFFKKVVDKYLPPLYTNKVGCETNRNGVLAQLGEHLPYKQRVIGSSPIGPTPTTVGTILIIYGEIAQLARAYGSYP